MLHQYDREMVRTNKRIEKWLIWPSGGKSFALTNEATAGVIALIMMMGATASGHDVPAWHAASSGLMGIVGAWIFINPDTSSSRVKLVAVASGAALGSLFGPLLAGALAYYFSWIGYLDYYLSGACGLAVGLLCTPFLNFLRKPDTVIVFIINFLVKQKK